MLGFFVPEKVEDPESGDGSVLFSKVQEAIDWWSSEVRGFALRAIASEHSGGYNIAQVSDVWDRIYKDWVYVSDPSLGGFRFTPASQTIRFGLRGDCDDFAVLTAASIVAIGGRARVVVREKNGELVHHAFAEVYLGRSEEEAEHFFQYLFKRYLMKAIHYSKDPEGIWLNLDWQANHPGGLYWGDRTLNIFYPSGDRGKFEAPPTLHRKEYSSHLIKGAREFFALVLILSLIFPFLFAGPGPYW